MFNNTDILAMLQSGQSADDIAQAFTDALNQAVAADNQAKAQAQKEFQKKEDTRILGDTIMDYLTRYYPDIFNIPGVKKEYDVEELIAAFDALMPLIQSTLALSGAFGISEPWANAHMTVSETKDGETKTASYTGDDAFAEFFKMYGL